MAEIHRVSVYDHHNHCLYFHVIPCCYQGEDSIMFAVYSLPPPLSTAMALGQMSVSTPVGGHPALNVFLWQIKGCTNRLVEQGDMR